MLEATWTKAVDPEALKATPAKPVCRKPDKARAGGAAAPSAPAARQPERAEPCAAPAAPHPKARHHMLSTRGPDPPIQSTISASFSVCITPPRRSTTTLLKGMTPLGAAGDASRSTSARIASTAEALASRAPRRRSPHGAACPASPSKRRVRQARCRNGRRRFYWLGAMCLLFASRVFRVAVRAW
jgi:hypothetical protein